MHFNFHLSGDESPEQSRRIANAVLALGGLLAPSKSVGAITVDLKLDTSQAVKDIRDLADKGASANVSVGYRSESTRIAECAAIDLARGSEPQLTEDDLPLDPPPCVEGERFAGALTSDEIRAVESLPPAPPVPPTLDYTLADVATGAVPTTSAVAPSGLDKHGLPWDERIHSSSRAINADGTWRYRKNVPDETKRDVEAELRGLVQRVVPSTVSASLAEQIDTGSHHVVHRTVEVTDDYGDGGTTRVPYVPVPPTPADAYLAGISPPTPPAPPVPTGALQRTYSDVVNLIMSRKVQPDTYVAILGMSLPEFAKHVISAPNDATLMFDALDAASRT